MNGEIGAVSGQHHQPYLGTLGTGFDKLRANGVLLAGVVWLLLWCLPLHAAAVAEPAGYVLTASGEVVAVQANKQLRPLKRKSPFFPGESLRTGESGKAQLRFRDGSLIALRASSEIRLDEFRFNEPQKGGDKNIFTLMSGGFRTITGKIGKGDPEAYQMKSSVASIGVRGTTYEAVLNGGLDVAAWQGTIIVANDQGNIAVGVDGVYNFASVQSRDQAPQGLMKPPASIRENQEIKPDEMTGEGKEGGDAAAEEGQSEQESEPASEPEPEVSLGDDGADVSGENVLDATITKNSAAVLESTGAEAQVISAYDILTTPTDPTTPTVPKPVTAADSRIEGVTLDRIAMAVGGGGSYSQMIAGGKAGYDSNGILHIADNSFDPSQVEFDTAPYRNVLSQGLAVAGAPVTHVIDASHTVEWGVWQAVATQPAYLMTDPTDISIYTAINQPIYWITATASTGATLAARTGTAEYRNVLGFAGESDSGPISDLYMNLSINFDSATAVGDMHIYAPSQYWNVKLVGSVAAPTLNFTSVSGTLNGADPIQGEFNTLFTGDTGQALVSSFDLASVTAPAIHVEGVVLVDDVSVADVRLTSAEWGSVDRVGIGYVASGLAGSQKYFGAASDGGSGSPIITDNGLPPGYTTGTPNTVVQQGGATLRAASVYSDSTYQLSWGIWDSTAVSAATVKNSFFDPLDKSDITSPLLWMTLTPTPSTATLGMTGHAQYKASGLNQLGFDSDGDALWTAQFGVHVNFDTAQFKGSGFVEDAGSYDDWVVDFDGVLDGSRLDVVNLSGNYNGIYGSNQAIGGDLEMYFIGGNAEALAGAFDLEWLADSSKYVVGAFEGFKDQRLTNAELAAMDRIGLSVSFNSVAGAQLYQGLASSGVSGNPILTQNGFLMSDSRFYSTAPNGVIRKGTAPDATWFTYSTDTTYGVSWGAWDAASGTPATLQNDYTNSASAISQTTPVMWLTVLPTDKAMLGTKSGAARFTTTYGSMARTGQGYFASTSHTLRADFDAGTFTGSAVVNDLEMATAGTWNVSYSGLLFGPNLNADTVTGKYTGYWGSGLAVGGDVSALFTGSTGEAVAGAFEFELISNPVASVQGVFISQQDLRVSNAEVKAMDHAGLFAANGVAYDTTLNSSGDSGTVPVFGIVGTQFDPQNPNLSPFQNVARPTGTQSTPLPSHNVAGDVAYRVNWGSWNGGFDVYTDPLNPAAKTFNPNDAYWMTLIPTPPANIPTTGVVTYNTPVGIVGGSPLDGAIAPGSFNFSANVDFATSNLSSGVMSFTAGTVPWNIAGFSTSFATTQKGGQFTVPLASGLRDGSETVTGNMNLLFTGPGAQGLAGGFSLGTASTTAQGVFLVCQSGGC